MQKPDRKQNNARHSSRRSWARWLILATGLAVSGAITSVAGVVGAYYFVAPGLPEADTIRDIPLQIPLRIFSRDGYLLYEEDSWHSGFILLDNEFNRNAIGSAETINFLQECLFIHKT